MDLDALFIAYRFVPRPTCRLLLQPGCRVSCNVMRKDEYSCAKLLISLPSRVLEECLVRFRAVFVLRVTGKCHSLVEFAVRRCASSIQS